MQRLPFLPDRRSDRVRLIGRMHTDDFEVILARIEISVTLHEWAGRKVPGFHFNWDLGLECAFLAQSQGRK